MKGLEGSKEYDDCPTFCKFSKQTWVLERTEYCNECKFTIQRNLFDTHFRTHVEEKFGEEVALRYNPKDFMQAIRGVLSVLDTPPDQITYRMSILRSVFEKEREDSREQAK